MDELVFSRLLGRKRYAVRELLRAMEDWDETADSHDEVLFSETIDKRQKMLETVMQIDGEMKAVAGKKGTPLSDDDAEQIRLTDEMLRQIQARIARDIQRTRSQMEEVSREAAKFRQRKNGMKAYARNSLPSREERLDIRG
jgi:hypothetical protein